ncbi:MAG: hypothetical protein M1114_00105 [Candidatus Dependentiae bacterium]|nr:hypothetical protein [Candidatus Dependentiae bacterium]
MKYIVTIALFFTVIPAISTASEGGRRENTRPRPKPSLNLQPREVVGPDINDIMLRLQRQQRQQEARRQNQNIFNDQNLIPAVARAINFDIHAFNDTNQITYGG